MHKLVKKLKGATILEMDLLKVGEQTVLLARVQRKKDWCLKLTLNGTIEQISQEDYSKLHRSYRPLDSPLTSRLQETTITIARAIKEPRRTHLHLMAHDAGREFWVEVILKGPATNSFREISRQYHQLLKIDNKLRDY